MIDYKQIVIDGYNAKEEQGTAYVSYFKQQARINERDYFVEFADFFSACRLAIKTGKQDIEAQYNKGRNSQQFMIDYINRELATKGFVEYGDGRIITNQQEIQESLERWENQRDSVSLNDFRYHIELETKPNYIVGYDLYYNTLVELEQAIIQAEQELTPAAAVKLLQAEQETPLPAIRQFTDEQKELLKSYFVAIFKGMGNNQNYFEENLLIDLQKNRTGKQYAEIALLIYKSDKFQKEHKKKPFASWYEMFCNLLGIEKTKYKPSQLSPNNMCGEFYYL